MDKEHSNEKESTEKPIRVDKTLQWLASSRDSWKEKTKESKTRLKISTLALKRAREHRDQLEEELHNIQKQLNQKDNEIAMLKSNLERTTQEIENLKKKS